MRAWFGSHYGTPRSVPATVKAVSLWLKGTRSSNLAPCWLTRHRLSPSTWKRASPPGPSLSGLWPGQRRVWPWLFPSPLAISAQVFPSFPGLCHRKLPSCPESEPQFSQFLSSTPLSPWPYRPACPRVYQTLSFEPVFIPNWPFRPSSRWFPLFFLISPRQPPSVAVTTVSRRRSSASWHRHEVAWCCRVCRFEYPWRFGPFVLGSSLLGGSCSSRWGWCRCWRLRLFRLVRP